MAAAIGPSSLPYFVPRSELLAWLNSTLSLGLTKVEQTASGAVACQLMDMLHPGTINMNKVDFNAKGEHEYINNYKVLQNALNKLEIDRFVDVNKLVKARPLDNLEFMQWFKAYFDQQAKMGVPGLEEYDPVARRQVAKTGDYKTPGMSMTNGAPAAAAPPSRSSSGSGGGGAASGRAPRVPSATSGGGGGGGGGVGGRARPGAAAPRAGPAAAAAAAAASHRKTGSFGSGSSTGSGVVKVRASSGAADERLGSLERQLEEMQVSQTDLQSAVENAERERDFYFDKLRDIEILCQLPELKNIEILKSIERILYATDPAEAKDTIVQVQLQYAQ